jgi:hypothetical protein
MSDEKQPEKQPLEVITLFVRFLEVFRHAPDEQRQAFLDFISPQSRADLLNLAEALRHRDGE